VPEPPERSDSLVPRSLHLRTLSGFPGAPGAGSDDGNGLADIFVALGPRTTFADGFECGDSSRWSAAMP
jgi:hypothetical protein